MSQDTAKNEQLPVDEKQRDGEATAGAGSDAASADSEPEQENEPKLSRDEYETLQAQVAERDKFLEELQRMRAEFDNYQKRVRRERPGWEDQAVRRLVGDLLSVVDNFERALDVQDDATPQSILEGVQLIHRMLLDTLDEHSVQEIVADGKPFDPAVHEAIQQFEIDDPEKDGTVVEVFEKGYTHKGTVVRPSKVVCGKFSGPVDDAESSGDESTSGADEIESDATDADSST